MVKEYRQRLAVLMLILFAACCVCGCMYPYETAAVSYYGREEKESPAEYKNTGEQEADLKSVPDTAAVQKEIFVYVCGCVSNPGVYRLTEGSRVYQAIEAAGGFLEDAGRNTLNLAAALQDGQQLYVPDVREEEILWKQPVQSGQQEDSLISLNRASAQELMQLPGIGETRAQAILAYREKNGSFGTIEEIMQVPGIKEAVFLKVKDMITVD